MAYRDEIDDGFDAVVFLEERCYEEGHKRGYQDGLLKGMEEGRELGMVKGSEVGGEVGFYLGFVSLWLEILNETPDPKQRHIKLLETLREMISSLPINDVTSEELFVNLEKIRAKYKQLCSLLGISTDYSGGTSGASF
ncbi:protein LTO1 homolog [Pocillopora damicornis]|uniref:protein LTO1 homolog n=1 Tax=Pocillopora damicornis TaxID=46731 RepID=UPI000F5593FF|nr:protein LTO1 homolog [Pocillopora damicornis]